METVDIKAYTSDNPQAEALKALKVKFSKETPYKQHFADKISQGDKDFTREYREKDDLRRVKCHMEVVLLPKAHEDLSLWIRSKNSSVSKKISQLTEAIIQNPYQGICKPEALMYQLTGKWSRRISFEDRYVY